MIKMLKKSNLALGFAFLFTLGIAGCGGGGGGDATINPAVEQYPNPPAQIQALETWKNLVSSGGSWETVGTDSTGSRYTQTVVVAKGSDKTYSDYGETRGPFYTATISSTTLKNGVNVGSKTQELYLTMNSYEVKFGRAPTYCFLSDVSFPIPLVATLNTGGTLFSATKFGQCIRLGSDGVVSASWTYESDKGIPFMCIKIDSENTCIETKANGTLGQKMRITTTGLTMKNY